MGTGGRMSSSGSSPSPDDLLALYLNDHLAGATGGIELLRRAAKSQLDETRRTALSSLCTEVEKDRDSLLEMMGRLNVKVARRSQAIGWLGEKAGRLKLNGTLLRRSPLSDLIELEAMRLGIEAKGCLWRSLRMLAGTDDRLEVSEFEALEQRAHAQIYELETMRLAAATALRG
jgi:hypothetical protein